MLFVNYVNIYECSVNFVCDMHVWIMDRHMNGCNICIYPFIRVSSDLYMFQIQIRNEISFFLFWKILAEAVSYKLNASVNVAS